MEYMPYNYINEIHDIAQIMSLSHTRARGSGARFPRMMQSDTF